MTLARRFINGRQQILLKKKPCRLFSKDTHILSPIIFLILCKNLVRTWLLWQTNWPLGQGTFFFACHPKHGVELLERIWWKYWGFIQNMPNHISTSSFFNTRAYFLSSLHPCGTSRAFRIQNYCTTFLCLF